MYYARRNGVLAECKTWGGGGLRKDGAIGVAEGGRRTGEGRGSMCVTCVAAITQSRGWLPGNAFQPPHTHTTLDQPQNPLLSLPYFTSWRTISFFWLSNTTSMPHCSTTFNADFNSRHCVWSTTHALFLSLHSDRLANDFFSLWIILKFCFSLFFSFSFFVSKDESLLSFLFLYIKDISFLLFISFFVSLR